MDAILTEALTWPAVRVGPSDVSIDGARALTLDGSTLGGPAEAFMVRREFCHVHAEGDFSLHATLPVPLAMAAERAGWAEPHFLVHTGQAPPTVVMLYAPRDDVEHDVVQRLVRASYEFALSEAPTRLERFASMKNENSQRAPTDPGDLGAHLGWLDARPNRA